MAAFAAVGTVRFPDTQRLLSCPKPTDDTVFPDRQMPTLFYYRDTANECPVIGLSGQPRNRHRSGLRPLAGITPSIASRPYPDIGYPLELAC